MDPGENLLAAAAQFLRQSNSEQQVKKVCVITWEGRKHSVELIDPVQAVAEINVVNRPTVSQPSGPRMPGLWLSPEEELVVKALADGEWHSGQEVADKLQLSRSGAFVSLLGNLVRREILDSHTRSGYRLARSVD